MVTVSLRLDDELNEALESLCRGQGRDKVSLVTDLIRRYVENEKLKRTLQGPALAQLYQQLAAEDVALAEEGMAEFQQLTHEADLP